MTMPDLVRRCLPALLVATVLLAGCDDEPEAKAPSGTDRAATAAPYEAEFPGLYLTSEVAFSLDSPNRLRLRSALDCTRLRGMVTAGQWRIADRFTLSAKWETAAGLLATVGLSPGDLLERGNTLAFAEYSGSGGCTGIVSKLPPVDITLDGTGLPGKTQGWTLTHCVEHEEASLDVTISFDTDARTGGLLSMRLAKSKSGYTLSRDEDSRPAPVLMTYQGSFLDALSKLIEAGGERTPKGVVRRELEPGASVTADLALEGSADQPPAGRLTLSGLADEKGEVAMSIPFACDKAAA